MFTHKLNTLVSSKKERIRNFLNDYYCGITVTGWTIINLTKYKNDKKH